LIGSAAPVTAISDVGGDGATNFTKSVRAVRCGSDRSRMV
jgi:hypothetical protein